MKKSKVLYLLPIGIFALLAAWVWSSRGGISYNIVSTGIYEVDLRITRVISRKNNTYEDLQWRLDIPREYVFNQLGINGKPAGSPRRGKSNEFTINLTGKIDFETMTVVPFANGAKGRMAGGENQVTIQLQNGSVHPKLRAESYCLKWNEALSITRPSSFTMPECDINRPGMCPVRMTLDGWIVELALDRPLYPEPERSCEAVKNFLNERTISRDSLLNQ